MRKTKLDPRILKRLIEKTKGRISEHSIRPALSRIRKEYPFLTLNAAGEIFAEKYDFSVFKYLNDKDRESLRAVEMKKIEIPIKKGRQTKKLIRIANYETDDRLLRAHLDEINKSYTHSCYTATFILCRKVLENLIIHHIMRKKYPRRTKEHRSKYFDFNRNRPLDFDKLLGNLRASSNDFLPDKKLVERICQLAEGFKETANEMTHSLYHIANKKEIDNKNFQHMLDLIRTLEGSL